MRRLAGKDDTRAIKQQEEGDLEGQRDVTDLGMETTETAASISHYLNTVIFH